LKQAITSSFGLQRIKAYRVDSVDYNYNRRNPPPNRPLTVSVKSYHLLLNTELNVLCSYTALIYARQ